MRTWEHKVNTINLRNLIKADEINKNDILKEIIKVWQQIKQFNNEVIQDEFTQNEIDEYIEDIELWVDDEDVNMEQIDGILNSLYNFADDLNIWLEL